MGCSKKCVIWACPCSRLIPLSQIPRRLAKRKSSAYFDSQKAVSFITNHSNWKLPGLLTQPLWKEKEEQKVDRKLPSAGHLKRVSHSYEPWRCSCGLDKTLWRQLLSGSNQTPSVSPSSCGDRAPPGYCQTAP